MPSSAGAAACPETEACVDLPHAVIQAWAHYAGCVGVVLAPSLAAARRQLLRTCRVAPGEPILVPPNATHGLVEDIKRCGARPLFGGLDDTLAMTHDRPVRVAWSQPLLGLRCASHVTAEITVVDHGDTVPAALPGQGSLASNADVVLCGLYLSPEQEDAGTILFFRDADLYARYLAEVPAALPSLYLRAAKQLARVRRLVERQTAALALVAAGLHAAAGLPLLPAESGLALSHGILVRIPDEGTPSTFWSYASAENTPVQWLPHLRPLHYAAVQAHRRSAANLERWLLVPVSPTSTEDENRQTVLGVVKAAEYTGLRWRTEPELAAQYARLLDSMYGPAHDAYRPIFPTPAPLHAVSTFLPEDIIVPSCHI